jgi:hypothetical protein
LFILKKITASEGVLRHAAFYQPYLFFALEKEQAVFNIQACHGGMLIVEDF